MTAAPARPSLPLLAKLNLALLAGFAFALSCRLWPEWLHNPDLSHGLFMPLLFLLMLHESRTAGPHRYLRSGPLVYGALTVFLVFALLALVLAGIYAASLGWSHALVEFLLVATLVFQLGAGLVGFSSERTRLIPCNWPAFVAIGLWLLSAPIPPGTYSRLTLGLQLFVSENVLRALHLLGVAARREGNVIELATATVGIEEACSGVRSLISCIFAGFFFSATLVRRPWARALVILLAAPLAMVMNFIRSLTLTLLANSGIDIAGTWHDVTGFAVLGVTAALLGGLALLLERRPVPGSVSVVPPPPLNPRPATSSSHLIPLAVALILSLALVTFFVRNTRPSLKPGGPAPNLLAILSAAAPGWRVDTSRDLYQFSDILKTEYLAQRTYLGRTAAGPTEVIIYLAYWRAGQSSVSSVAAHTPDACWPGSGWLAVPNPVMREAPVVAGRTLALAESRIFQNAGHPQHVWFWHLYDGHPIAYENPYSTRELLSIAWRYGFRRDGDQLFVRVSSNRPWADIADEPFIRDCFARLQPLGL
ncbi:MAG: exosortase-associated EpsI family protein [Undibacterium sp.]|nr:exosortase-associated EpsI family protein [Opitutaceae bacterium]